MVDDRTSASIMIVDDTPANLKLLEEMLRIEGYRVAAFPQGDWALKGAAKNPPDLVLLDINMPQMDGYEVCKRLKEDETLREIPVIFISALNETMDKVKAFAVGGVDYITKPFQFDEVKARIETHLKLRWLQRELEKHNRHLETLVQSQVKEIADSQMATIFALAKLAESRDDDTGQHLERVQTFCKLLAEALSAQPPFRGHITKTYTENILRASPLHDIGKVAIPDSILQKPAKLDADEFAKMQRHTILGAQTLEAVRDQYPGNSFIKMCIAIAQWHHEKWDGSGYPHGLTGEDVPLSARIMAVADVYDALRSRRCYKPAFPHEESRRIITEGSGRHFDPAIVQAFLTREVEIASLRDNMDDPIDEGEHR